MLYTGVSGAQIMDSLNVSTGLMEGSRASVEQVKQQVKLRAKAAGASLVCQYRRNSKLIDVVEGTSELNEQYYRLSAGCVPFRMTDGEPFFQLIIHSPDSDAAAAAVGDVLFLHGGAINGQRTHPCCTKHPAPFSLHLLTNH